MGKPEERIPLVRLRRRWENNIKMDLRKTRLGRGLIVAEDRDRRRALVNAVMGHKMRGIP
jgi:hypothetical protein